MTMLGQVPFMPLENAVEVVLDLARQGSLSSPMLMSPRKLMPLINKRQLYRWSRTFSSTTYLMGRNND